MYSSLIHIGRFLPLCKMPQGIKKLMITSIAFSQLALPCFSHAASISPPRNLCIVVVTTNSVNLAWDPISSGVNGYRLYWGQASGNYTANLDVGNQTTYTVPGLQYGKTYYIAVKAYSYDSAGQRIESGFSNEVSATPGTPASSTCNPIRTIWDRTVPAGGLFHDEYSNSQLGVKFTADVSGYIVGIRFYKKADWGFNYGDRIGTLWSRYGTLLASAFFTNETASGWQEAYFNTSVPIIAKTVYVASYYSSYDPRTYVTEYAFSLSGVDNPPLHVLPDGASGGNGVYAYGRNSFPSSSRDSSNYWVDVLFTTQ